MHNDANVLSMGERLVPAEEVEPILKVWLETPFEGGRHQRRIDQIDDV
jgi:ribose 5-phosphate isomerase B